MPCQMKKGLELVPQQMYSDGKMPSSDSQTAMAGDILGHPQSALENLKNSEHELGRHQPLGSRFAAQMDSNYKLHMLFQSSVFASLVA